MSPDAVYAKHPDYVQRNVAGECILVPIRRSLPDRNSIYVLNESGAALWNRIDGRRPIHVILDDVQAEYDVERDRLAADVEVLLTDLLSIQAIEEVFVAHAPTG